VSRVFAFSRGGVNDEGLRTSLASGDRVNPIAANPSLGHRRIVILSICISKAWFALHMWGRLCEVQMSGKNDRARFWYGRHSRISNLGHGGSVKTNSRLAFF
jgi:hypothetical protein